MAMGSVTVLKKGVFGPGGLRYALLEVQPTSGANYVTGGDIVGTNASFGFKKGVVHFAHVEPKLAADRTQHYYFDTATNRLVAFPVATPQTELAAAQDLSGRRVRIFVVGQ